MIASLFVQVLLRRYQFPGNFRELSNLMERAVLFCQGPTLEAANFPFNIQGMLPPFAENPAGAPDSTANPSDPMTVQILFGSGEDPLRIGRSDHYRSASAIRRQQDPCR
jgi:two-component system response regulator AtoC